MILTSCIIAFLFPVVSLPFSLYEIRKDFANWRIYITLLALFFAVVAYCYTPVNDSPDIVTYFDWAETLGTMSFSQAFTYNLKSESNLYLMNILLWVGGKLNDVHLIPAVSVFLVYYILFYITCYVGEKEKVSSKYVFTYILFAIATLSLYSITNNVRNVLGFCLVGLACFRDLYQKKRNAITLLLYILPLFLHPAILIIVLLRIILFIPGNYKLIFVILASQVIPITNFLYQIASPLASSGNVILLLIWNAISKGYWYYRNENSAWAIAVANSGSQQLAKVAYIFIVVVLSIAVYIFQRQQLKSNNNEEFIKSGKKDISDFIFYLGIITVACAPMPMPEYWRFASVFIVMAGSIVILIYKKRGKWCYVFSRMAFIATPICFALWIRSISRSDLIYLICGPIVMNPIVIVVKDLLSVLTI